MLMEESMRGRVPQLVALKYERMVESPFGYFRGAVPVMAADLSTLANTGIITQICGDAHVRNLGAFAAPDGRLVFDINDFDETKRAPFEWDLKRLATSESGFIFDPATGDSFTANATALAIIKLAATESDPARIAEQLAIEFEVSKAQAEREVVEFASVLRQALSA